MNRTIQHEILDLFKVMIVDYQQSNAPAYNTWDISYIGCGVVLNFIPNKEQRSILLDVFNPLDINVLFSREERETSDPVSLMTKQILHYIEVYGLGAPGLFDLEVSAGQVVTMNYVKGVTPDEFAEMVRKLLYANAPIKDAVVLKQIIRETGVFLDVNKIANNEMRVAFFDPNRDNFTDGDDVVRYMCYAATGDLMLIKSPEVIKAVQAHRFNPDFLERHAVPLSNVFNRHKKLIMAAKRPETRTQINRISRLSKQLHVPVHEPIAKKFVARALTEPALPRKVLAKVSVRDLLKYLNLLAYKRSKNSLDVFIIRNGKTHIEPNRRTYSLRDIERVEQMVLGELKNRLEDLRDQEILLDPDVDYGLPTSRKQTLGNLPYGTLVTVYDGEISSGMYWENEWGATDLDLSTIDTAGRRTGWGQRSGYDHRHGVTFSGDLTDARNGAMEFMTSKEGNYGLFVNIYSGSPGCEMELVVGGNVVKKTGSYGWGNRHERSWIENPIIREKHKLNSRGNVIGFVRDNNFVVYSGRLNSAYVSGPRDQAVLARGMAGFWTVRGLFNAIGVGYALDRDPDVTYNHELGYEGFTYDKLEALLLE